MYVRKSDEQIIREMDTLMKLAEMTKDYETYQMLYDLMYEPEIKEEDFDEDFFDNFSQAEADLQEREEYLSQGGDDF